MHKKLKISVVIALVSCSIVAMASPATLKAKLDSVSIVMGSVTRLHLELVQDKSALAIFPIDRIDTLTSAVEVNSRFKADTIDLGNNRIQINKDVLIQSFDSGMYQLPPVICMIGKDTVKSNALTLKVIPVKVDPNGDIKDYKPIENAPFHLLDWVPDVVTDYWWAFSLLALLILGGLLYYLHRRRRAVPGMKVEKKRLPPYEEAIQGLQALRSSNLWQQGHEKQYYTTLTDILRVYIDRRFGINAVEMTSTQIIDTLRSNTQIHADDRLLNEVLAIADFVKFTNERPAAQENEITLDRAIKFVEDSKPTAEEAASATEEGNEEKEVES